MNSSSPPPRVVVVVEDDALIRLVLSEALTDAGFNVIVAADASDALMLMDCGASGIYALVTDNRMPGTMSGVKLARHTREQWPWIKLVVAAQLVDEQHRLPNGCRYFQKPYKVADLVGHLQQQTAAAE